MDQKAVLLTIVGMSVVTYLPRLLPAWFLSSRPLPALVAAWLRYVPVAVLAAMLLPAITVHAGHVDFGSNNLFFWVAVPTFVLAWKKRSLFGPVLLGMALIAAARALL
jgi:branched-subunit amino acid transport protein